MTSSIVEAQCPGCNNVLRIPASWVDQAMRCKCCGRVFQMRQAPAIPIAVAASPAFAAAQPIREAIPIAPPPIPAWGVPQHEPLIYFDAQSSRRRRRFQKIAKLALLVGCLAGVAYLACNMTGEEFRARIHWEGIR